MIATAVGLLGILLGGCDRNRTPAIIVFASSSLRPALDPITVQYSNQRPSPPVEVRYAATGTLIAQIQQGAPADLIISADASFLQPLVKTKHADVSDMRYLAQGNLVLASKKDLPAVRGEQNRWILDWILSTDFSRIAIPNPAVAPYGMAARRFLEDQDLHKQDQISAESDSSHLNFHENLQSKIVIAENVEQALQWIHLGVVDAGFVSESLVVKQSMSNQRMEFIECDVPDSAESSFKSLTVTACVLSASKVRPEASQFVDFLLAESGQAIFRSHGFRSVELNKLAKSSRELRSQDGWDTNDDSRGQYPFVRDAYVGEND